MALSSLESITTRHTPRRAGNASDAKGISPNWIALSPQTTTILLECLEVFCAAIAIPLSGWYVIVPMSFGV